MSDLNSRSTDAGEQDSAAKQNVSAETAAETGESCCDRRAVMAGTVGAVITLAPLGVGAAVFLDPLRSKPEERRRQEWIAVGSLDEIPQTGVPVRREVRADMWDQWTFAPNQPVGSVFLYRNAGEEVPTCFNSICPHAGCRVSYSEDESAFLCPCHNSAFNLDGSTRGRTPSPRSLDKLRCEVKDGTVLVEYKDFYTGKAEQVEKA